MILMNRFNFLNMLWCAIFLLQYPSHQATVFAQPADIAVAIDMSVEGSNIRKGAIVTNDGQTIKTSTEPYDNTLFGVIVENPSILIAKKDKTGSIPVATSGNVQVLVNNENGVIKKGHYITSSSVEGIGMKARVPGRVIGIALVDMPESESNYIMPVAVKVEYVTAQALQKMSSLDGNIKDYDGNPFGTTTGQTKIVTYLRYGISALLGLSGFVFATYYYTQISKKEIEAIGRNPIAINTLRSEMQRHAIAALLIALAGVALAFLIYRI